MQDLLAQLQLSDCFYMIESESDTDNWLVGCIGV